MSVPSEDADVDTAGLLITLGICTTAVMVIFPVFGVLRAKYPRFYARRARKTSSSPLLDDADFRSGASLASGRSTGSVASGAWMSSQRGGHFSLRPGRLGWLPSLWAIDDTSERALTRIGIDGYLYLRFHRMCLKLMIFMTFIGLPILMPVYSAGGESRAGLNIFNMSNLRTGSVRFWAPLVMSYLFTLATLYVLFSAFKHIVEVRFYYKTLPLAENFSVRVEGVPGKIENDTQLNDYFQSIFPGQIIDARLAIYAPDLTTIVQERDVARDRLELGFLQPLRFRQQLHRAATPARTGHARADHARRLLGALDQEVGLGPRGLEVVAQARM
mgnify:CR=1 FL=1